MADMDKLKEKIALALRRRNLDGPYNAATEWHDLAAAVLTAIESAGYVLMPKDQILRKMTKDEFSELMAGIPFRENDLGCQASPGIKGETVSREGALQSGLRADDAEDMRIWYSTVRRWSGSAFLANEFVEDEAYIKSQLYLDLCRLGNHLDNWAHALETNSQSPIEEAQRADTESAANAEVSLTHKPLPPSPLIEGE
jgi:hypothetical protein